MKYYSEYAKLTDEQRDEVDEMLSEYRQLFALREDDSEFSTFAELLRGVAQECRDWALFIREEQEFNG